MTQQEASPIRGWTVVLAAVSINLILGVLYAWSVMGKALVVQWHWSKADASLPFTISAAAFALMMIFAGRWQDKIGPRYVAMLGGIILGAGLVALLVCDDARSSWCDRSAYSAASASGWAIRPPRRRRSNGFRRPARA